MVVPWRRVISFLDQCISIEVLGYPRWACQQARRRTSTGRNASWIRLCGGGTNRSSKPSPRHPDFQHKVAKGPLWRENRDNPSWFMENLMSSATDHQCIGAIVNSSSMNALWSGARIFNELRSCCKNKDLLRGTRLHHELQRRGFVEKDYSDILVTMYAKCGESQTAQALLHIHNSSSIIPWNALIAGYSREGKGQNALDCFEHMQHKGLRPDEVTYLSILKACAGIRAINKGKQIHDEISRKGLLQRHVMLGNALVDMYAKCGAFRQAKGVLEKFSARNVVSWSALISGYVQNAQGQQALDCFEQMQHEGILPDEVTYMSILKACAMIGAIDKGKQIHDEISKQGLLKHHVALGNTLVDMYAKCGALHLAQSVLEKLPSRNVFSLISGFAQNGQGQQALDCFEQMQHEGILPNEVTYLCILKACAVSRAIDKGKQIHDEISAQGLLECHVVLGNALVDMYAKCGVLRQARNVLENLSSRNVVSWSALISGYSQSGQGQQALESYWQMQHEGILPDEVTYVCVLNACAMIRAIDKGKQIHDEILAQGLLKHQVVLGNALVDMYAKCSALCQAQSILEKLPSRDVVSWNALISGYAQNGQGQQALDCFEQMQHEGILPTEVTYVCILQACAAIGAVNMGKLIHDEILLQGFLEHHIVLGGALVDMYAKCGDLHQAHRVLEKLPSRNAIHWNSLLAGYAQKGQGKQALNILEQMQHQGVVPDEVTLICLLDLCSHLGLVEKGQELFDSMGAMYGLKPNLESFTCMVDLYGRAGNLVKAVEVIQGVPFATDFAVWHCLLSACRKWVDVNVGTWAFEQAVELDNCDRTAYELMTKICAESGMQEKAEGIEASRIDKSTWKLPGCSMWNSLKNNNAYESCVGYTKYVQSNERDLKFDSSI